MDLMSDLMGAAKGWDSIENRRVSRYDGEDLIISTVAIPDSEQPYETAISHCLYKYGKWIIVEMYNLIEESQIGHDKWVGIMAADELPDELRDVATSEEILDAEALCDLPDDSHRVHRRMDLD